MHAHGRMTWLAMAAGLAAGCAGSESNLIRTPPVSEANTEAARRVDAVGRAVVTANPGVGGKPMFRTIGAKSIELFHTREGEFTVVCVTEGLVERCESDAQLAAVLCSELARITAGNDMLARATAKPAGYRPPPQVSPGTDADPDGFSADRVRLAELAKDQERYRKQHPSADMPDADVLTRTYLKAAGYPADLADAVPALTKGAGVGRSFEKLFTGGGLRW